MIVALGADHAGWVLKQELTAKITAWGHAVVDLGTSSAEPVDYPDYAAAVARAVVTGAAERGIIVCGSGVGACVAANKVAGARAAVCHDTFSAHQGVEDDDLNVLCLGARVIGPEVAFDVARVFLEARFSGAERHRRRLSKIRALEEEF